MANHRFEHVKESINREVNAVIRSLKDPRLQNKFITIITSRVSRDGTIYKIFISSIEGFEKSKKIAKNLNSACGFIKLKISKRLRLRFMPELIFEPTDSSEYGVKMINRINTLSEGEKFENID